MSTRQQPTDDSQPDEQDTDAMFRQALDNDAPAPGDVGGVSIWQMTEEQLQDEIVKRCKQRRLLVKHMDTPHHNKRRYDNAGFPDLFLCGPNGVLFRELKKQRYRNTSPAQTTWKYSLLAAGQNYAMWQPSDLKSGRVDAELDRLGSW